MPGARQDEGRKIIMKRLVRGEKGYVLIAALVVLVVLGLISGPLLSYMVSGLRAGHIFETGAAELYAADAGVQDAVLKIPSLCQGGHFTIPDVNGKVVDVTVTLVNNVTGTLTYKITSIAVTDGGGNTAGLNSSTQIEAYISGVTKSSGILDHVITSPCGYDLQRPSEVSPPEGEHGPEGSYTGAWPTVEMLSDLYGEDVAGYPYATGSLDVKDYAGGIGPLYRDGTLDIKNKGDKGLTVALNGTLYITGDTSIGTTDVGKNFTIDLNGQTIFVESDTGAAPEDDPCSPGSGYALKIGGGCTLTGSGCIIAVGNIEFKPNLSCTEGDYILVLSVSGKTYMQPNGYFYGTLAGNAEVYIQNGDATWTDYSTVEGGLNFPTLPGTQQVFYSISSWQVSRQ
jgi:hypothetical protein